MGTLKTIDCKFLQNNLVLQAHTPREHRHLRKFRIPTSSGFRLTIKHTSVELPCKQLIFE